mmetsp:Transcript_51295/g.141985  ORF Transcript_51295/g.141985 Transcript_51295/m.141985 type:complete len:250 (+) Transcript_51295:116-865(+)
MSELSESRDGLSSSWREVATLHAKLDAVLTRRGDRGAKELDVGELHAKLDALLDGSTRYDATGSSMSLATDMQCPTPNRQQAASSAGTTVASPVPNMRSCVASNASGPGLSGYATPAKYALQRSLRPSGISPRSIRSVPPPTSRAISPFLGAARQPWAGGVQAPRSPSCVVPTAPSFSFSVQPQRVVAPQPLLVPMPPLLLRTGPMMIIQSQPAILQVPCGRVAVQRDRSPAASSRSSSPGRSPRTCCG